MEDKKWIDHVIEYAERELELINFDKTDVGSTMIEFLRQAAALSQDDKKTMKQIVGMLDRLVDQLPISIITDDDFVEETRPDGKPMARCTRYKYLYRAPDGRYYDDRAVAFKRKGEPESNRQYIYQGNMGSKQEVSLPYMPNEKIVYLEDIENGS